VAPGERNAEKKTVRGMYFVTQKTIYHYFYRDESALHSGGYEARLARIFEQNVTKIADFWRVSLETIQ
jgi:hypothetical protein